MRGRGVGAWCDPFRGREGENGGDDEGEGEDGPEDGLGDEDEVGGVPAGVEGKEGTDAVVIGEVEKEMGERCGECGEVDPGPADFEKGGSGAGSPGWRVARMRSRERCRLRRRGASQYRSRA